MTRFWSLASGPVSLFLIASHFTRELQGYYYTFRNLLTLQVFVELGLGQVILQFASHEWSRLRLDEQGGIVGDREALSRLVSLGRFAFKWYSFGGALIAVGLGLGGFIFFSRSPQIGIRWIAPWFALCLLSGVDLCGLSLWSLLQGCGQVTQVYGFHLVQGLFRSLFVWLAILLGAGLWTAPVESFIGLAWAALFLFGRYRRFFRAFRTPAVGPSVRWRTEMLPFQWRIALSWLSGYFIFSLFTPTIFKLYGPIAAGQMGMTWALVGALSTVSATWIYAKAPRFGVLVARKNYAALDRLAWRSGAAAFCVACAGGAVLEGIIYYLNAHSSRLATRLLPPLPAGLFLLATVLMQISTPQSVYLRAHKREPFLVLSVVSGLLTGISTVWLGRHYGATGMGAGYLAVVVFVILPFGTIILQRCRTTWHARVTREQVASDVSEMSKSDRPAGNGPSLSVVLPNYNHAQYIGEALEAILTQSFRPREVIVVDDGSTDNSLEVIEEFARRDPIVRLLRNGENRGVIFSTNRGLEQASGDFILFAGADDKVLPGLFERSGNLLAQFPHAGACSAVAVFVDEQGKVLRLVPPRPWVSKDACYLPPDEVLSGWRRYGWLFPSNTCFYRRDALLEAGGFPQELRSAADSFALMNLALSHGACFISEPLGIFTVRESSYSSEFRSHEVALDLLRRGEELIRTTYARHLPKHYVDEWTKQLRYSSALTAHKELCLQRKECLWEVERSLAKATAMDRLFLSLLRLATVAEHGCVHLYLFARLRHVSWPLLRRKLQTLRQESVTRKNARRVPVRLACPRSEDVVPKA
jgi:glycosyltransferase involved in cell wall biosynthesis/O-antigen/teichoic acid export membrane protein